jgi:hypothetical protein
MTTPSSFNTSTDPVRVRRVVTGIDPSGHSVIFSDGQAPQVAGDSDELGYQIIEMWQTQATPPDLSGEDLSGLPYELEPVPGGVHWRLVVWPERDVPGHVHRTDTLDMLYILSGQVVLGVGDDAESMHDVQLSAGDAVVALANVHCWRNPGPGRCVALATMVSSLPLSD